MRILLTLMSVLALGVMGCSETTGAGGSGGEGGAGGDGGSGGATPECQSPEDCDDDNECTDDTCLAGVCEFMPVPDPTGPDEPGDPPGEGTTCGYYEGTCEGGSCTGTFPCTEPGIREAIAAGAGPHTFDCDGPTTVVTEAEIVIDKDVVLDGEGNLILSANAEQYEETHVFFHIEPQASAGLHGLTLSHGGACIRGLPGFCVVRGMIWNEGTLILEGSVFTDAPHGAFVNDGSGTMVDVTVSNLQDVALLNVGTLVMLRSTVSDNQNSLYNDTGATLTVVNSTVSNNGADIDHPSLFTFHGSVNLLSSTVVGGIGGTVSDVRVLASLIVGGCDPESVDVTWVSEGYNIESPGDTCGFDPDGTDQVNVTEGELKLGPLADYGGPTMTHALGAGSVAIDHIPVVDCVGAEGERLQTDQRGEPRYVGPPFGPGEPVGDGCDVGSFEVQP